MLTGTKQPVDGKKTPKREDSLCQRVEMLKGQASLVTLTLQMLCQLLRCCPLSSSSPFSTQLCGARAGASFGAGCLLGPTGSWLQREPLPAGCASHQHCPSNGSSSWQLQVSQPLGSLTPSLTGPLIQLQALAGGLPLIRGLSPVPQGAFSKLLNPSRS